MLAMEFLKSGESVPLKPIYAVFGEEAWLRRESIETILKTALGADSDDRTATVFPGETATLAQVFDELRTLPFLAKARVVLVDNADPFVSAHRKELEAFAEKPTGSGHLILSVKSWPSNTRLAKQVERVGLAIDAKSPSSKELPKWLVGLAKSRSKVAIDADAAELMLDLVGPEVGLLAMELEKLAVYVGERKKVDRHDVATMVGAGRAQVIWSAITAATCGNGASALATLDSLFAANESPHEMLGAIRYSLLKTYHAGMLRKNRVEAKEACMKAGINNYGSAIETTLRQHAHLGPGRVERLPAMLLQAELDLKGASQLPPRTVIERLFTEFARPRLD